MSLRKITPADNNDKVNNAHREENNNNNTIHIRLIPYIKCWYCNSEFDIEEEKNEHELELHV